MWHVPRGTSHPCVTSLGPQAALGPLALSKTHCFLHCYVPAMTVCLSVPLSISLGHFRTFSCDTPICPQKKNKAMQSTTSETVPPNLLHKVSLLITCIGISSPFPFLLVPLPQLQATSPLQLLGKYWLLLLLAAVYLNLQLGALLYF
jgi:hypothetical protein